VTTGTRRVSARRGLGWGALVLAFKVGIVGMTSARVAAAARAVRPAMLTAMKETMSDVWRRATKKVSGDVLKVRSGHLRRSLGPPRVGETASGVAGTLGARAIYARIHEEGGTIPPHIVRPRFAKALRFLGKDGRLVFARSARIPAIRIRPRPFLRPSFEEAMPTARTRFIQAILQGFNET